MQPFRDIFNLCDHIHVLSRQDFEREIVIAEVFWRFDCVKLDPVDPVDLVKIHRSNQIGQGLVSGDTPSVISQIPKDLVSQAAWAGRGFP
jgi:hypothetical protein